MTEGIAERKKGAAIKEKSSAVGSERENKTVRGGKGRTENGEDLLGSVCLR